MEILRAEVSQPVAVGQSAPSENLTSGLARPQRLALQTQLWHPETAGTLSETVTTTPHRTRRVNVVFSSFKGTHLRDVTVAVYVPPLRCATRALRTARDSSAPPTALCTRPSSANT